MCQVVCNNEGPIMHVKRWCSDFATLIFEDCAEISHDASQLDRISMNECTSAALVSKANSNNAEPTEAKASSFMIHFDFFADLGFHLYP